MHFDGDPAACAAHRVKAACEPETSLCEEPILVVGAGGLGCEVLKLLVESGVMSVMIIDYDMVAETNFNRQFLFSEEDIGKPKASAALRGLSKWIPTTLRDKTNVECFVGSVQDFGAERLSSFNIILLCLDNVDARRWVNSAVIRSQRSDDGLLNRGPFLVDGGSEGLNGQIRLIAAPDTACYECTMWSQSAEAAIPLCTLRTNPRVMEHCIEWARIREWPDVRGDEAFDVDIAEHIGWVHRRAVARAIEFEIEEKDERFTISVLKKIIPAVACTNAFISANMVALVLSINMAYLHCQDKAFGDVSQYLMYRGESGSRTIAIDMEKDANCSVCGPVRRRERKCLDPEATIQDFIGYISNCDSAQIFFGQKVLYWPKMKSADEVLKTKLKEFGIIEGSVLTVMGDANCMEIVIVFK